MEFMSGGIAPPSRSYYDEESEDEEVLDTPDSYTARQPVWRWSPDVRPHLPLHIPNLVVALGCTAAGAVGGMYGTKGQSPVATCVLKCAQLGNNTLSQRQPTDHSVFTYQPNPSTLLVVATHHIAPAQAPLWSESLFAHVIPERVVVLTGRPFDRYVSMFDAPEPPFVRSLHTTNLKPPQAHLSACPTLEQPNIVDGAAAATLKHCQIHSLPCTLLVCYTEGEEDEVDSQPMSLLADTTAHMLQIGKQRAGDFEDYLPSGRPTRHESVYM
eukprot:comp16706_c0_seq1/m.14975 comp16706_c0_seq1/g.14975  ORF comp16706_c0_seq1/g.14975 comp16706_c0_seq1/m.14975 type:complete len:270 (-) comp16706_c0_seq1:224-1033(-)